MPSAAVPDIGPEGGGRKQTRTRARGRRIPASLQRADAARVYFRRRRLRHLYPKLRTSDPKGAANGTRSGGVDQEAEQDLPRRPPGGGRALPLADQPQRRGRALAAQARRAARHRPARSSATSRSTPSRLQRDLTRAIDGFKTGNAADPDALAVDRPARPRGLGPGLGPVPGAARSARACSCWPCSTTRSSAGWPARPRASWPRSRSSRSRPNLMKIVAGSAEDEGPPAAGPAAAGEGRRRPRRPAAAQTPALDQYTVNLTDRARAGKIDPVLGRDAEVRQMVDILIRRRQNNPILTGEAGVGKTAVVEGFALRIAAGDVPPALKNVVAPDARPRPAPGRRGGQGGVREPAQAGDRRGQGVAGADHPVHRRGPHHDRRRRPGRAGRRRQPAQAGPGPGRAPDDRRDDLGRVQEVLREGRRPRPPVPGRQGRGARRGPRHPA